MQCFSRRVDYSRGVKPKKRYMMFLSRSTGEGKGQKVVEKQLCRDFSEQLDVFGFVGSDGIHLKVMKKSANEIVGLLDVYEASG